MKCKSKCSHHDDFNCEDGIPFTHKIQLFLGDAYGVRVPNTEFYIKLTIIKEGPKVTIQLPCINFETGQFANDLYEVNNPTAGPLVGIPNFLPPPQNGGYLFTSKGFLPKELRPTDLINQSYFGPSNDGMNIPFNYTGIDLTTGKAAGVDYVPPVPGFMIQVTREGGLIVQGLGTLGNIIPPGPHSLLPTTITYIIKPDTQLCKNVRISRGEINTAIYPFTPTVHRGAQDALRDLHANDAYDNVVAYAWSDNSNVPDRVNRSNIMNVAVAIGKVRHGKLQVKEPIFIHQEDNFAWDTSIAINRTNSKNIVVSWGLIEFTTPPDSLAVAKPWRAVSFDGGVTWPINGLMNVQPTGTPSTFGDNAGVRADKYGNFWYLSSNRVTDAGFLINQPYVAISSDGGINWTRAYTLPIPNVGDIYDFPTMTFGGDGLGNYGVHIIGDYFPLVLTTATYDGYPAHAFIPVTGLGTYKPGETIFLPQFTNNNFIADIAASDDGKVWTYGVCAGLGPANYPFPGSSYNNNNHRMIYKSPGALTENYVGPWTVDNADLLSESLFIPTWSAQPIFGFFNGTRTVLYDDKRKALYALTSIKSSDDTADSQIFLIISRNNGQTWSNPLKVATTDFANRGWQSMALDTVTNNLLIGWYDGRRYENLTGLNYFGAVIEAEMLDDLICEIPLSNPTYIVPPPVVVAHIAPTPVVADIAPIPVVADIAPTPVVADVKPIILNRKAYRR
jgi:hypothetical protein